LRFFKQEGKIVIYLTSAESGTFCTRLQLQAATVKGRERRFPHVLGTKCLPNQYHFSLNWTKMYSKITKMKASVCKDG